MRPSYYLKTYPCRDNPDQFLLFSTKKASAILLDRETFQAMQKGTLSASDEAKLEKLKMLVPDRDAEKQAMLSLLDDQNPKKGG